LLNSNRPPNSYSVVSLDEHAVPFGTAGEAVTDAGRRSSAVVVEVVSAALFPPTSSVFFAADSSVFFAALTSLKRVQQCVF
jgi:hypothetical protein